MNTTKYEIRDPIYGFVELNEWERDIVNSPAFQRLRRIKQLGMTEMVYPSAVHTRFEHSLGVMHLATKLYDNIVRKDEQEHVLDKELRKDVKRDRQMVRLASLLHDVGHTAFSHTSEDLLPSSSSSRKSFKHEDYTTAIIQKELKNIIDNHPLNTPDINLKADTIAGLIEGDEEMLGGKLFWKLLVSGQLDADRGDYLLRDSYHMGVKYGVYDVERLAHTITLGHHPETGDPILCVKEGGWHTAESLVIARYQMFTQVYFHKTRRSYDYHLTEALKSILPSHKFPGPDQLKEFHKWDDHRVMSSIFSSSNLHAVAIRERRHARSVYSTPESPTQGDIEKLQNAKKTLGKSLIHEDKAETACYKVGDSKQEEIFIKNRAGKVAPLSSYSSIVKNMDNIKQTRLYVLPEDRNVAQGKLKKEGLI